MKQTPTIGRMVHYHDHTTYGYRDELIPIPAVIVDVKLVDNGRYMLDLHLLLRGKDALRRTPYVISALPNGMQSEGAPYWDWPPRV